MRAQLADMEDLLESINKILGELGKWTIEVYDIGECDEYVCHRIPIYLVFFRIFLHLYRGYISISMVI